MVQGNGGHYEYRSKFCKNVSWGKDTRWERPRCFPPIFILPVGCFPPLLPHVESFSRIHLHKDLRVFCVLHLQLRKGFFLIKKNKLYAKGDIEEKIVQNHLLQSSCFLCSTFIWRVTCPFFHTYFGLYNSRTR